MTGVPRHVRAAKYVARMMTLGDLAHRLGQMDNRETLERRLERARARCAEQPPYSPDWDAAMGEIDELVARLALLAPPEPIGAA